MKQIKLKILLSLGLLLISLVPINSQAKARIYLGQPNVCLVRDSLTKISVYVDSDEKVNAILGNIIFPEDKLNIIYISSNKSIIDLWIKRPSELKGTIGFAGIMTNPVIGERNKVLDIFFIAKKTGEIPLKFSSHSLVLAHDGKGTNVLKTLNGITLKILK